MLKHCYKNRIGKNRKCDYEIAQTVDKAALPVSLKDRRIQFHVKATAKLENTHT